MIRIAIVGSGPTGLYSLHNLLKCSTPLAITVFEQGPKAGVGMPYDDRRNARMLLANIASIEIPPIIETYCEWLLNQDSNFLGRFGVARSAIHERKFLPRVLLGEYFHAQLTSTVQRSAELGHTVVIKPNCRVVDVELCSDHVRVVSCDARDSNPFDYVILATGHVFPEGHRPTSSYFPSPWSGLMSANVPACRVGIMGTSLSAIDAAMAVAIQHGGFTEEAGQTSRYIRDNGADALFITLMSRSGLLPEADFYCPIPYEPLKICTEHAVSQQIEIGSQGLLGRIFELVKAEIKAADAVWSARVDLDSLSADEFVDAYFVDRRNHDPFEWASYNLYEAEENKQAGRTVPWRYAILRLHEAIQNAVQHFDEHDRTRFDEGLSKVFIDNYAAVPAESIRRLLALRRAGIIDVLELGDSYVERSTEGKTIISAEDDEHEFDVFIDARGQQPLTSADMPFPSLKNMLLRDGIEHVHVSKEYWLECSGNANPRIVMAAIPYLMRDYPFIQGITASSKLGETIAGAITGELQ